ncbi:sulfite exporter TauE/SafE family protein [Salisediminibacterium selenitireducens]|uniref:Probable membrane transporter protein n=1 Tax=Bacillus selenitireducens (strain ATCC 700615 / DSM 15326 / MLS10) TaxID=439292 RepID=D6Y171_BACIE|nr:sulfite exporter TauE/SafE family protein [Salisediminibacterium selenitireducens]ADH98675.1 protein of unknown function DUF81 [[Bacillus] selenitireducens MLS10]
MEWLVLLLLGFAAATLGSLIGLGGGIIVVPGLLILQDVTGIISGITPQVAVGTSLLIMIFTGLSSTLSYVKQKSIDLKSGLVFFIGSGPGAIFGVWLNQGLVMNQFLVIFGTFMIVISIVLWLKKHVRPLSVPVGRNLYWTDHQGVEWTYGYQPVIGIMLGFIVGSISGLFGIGGGSLMVPAMILLFAFPPHLAVATSMFMIMLSAIVGSVSHILVGNVHWLYALALIPGAWFGGKSGALLNRRLSSDRLVLLLRIFLIILAFRLLWQGMTG